MSFVRVYYEDAKALSSKDLLHVRYNAGTLPVGEFTLKSRPSPATSVRFAEFELDLQTGELCRDSAPLKLQPQPAKILSILVSRAGEVVTRQELVEQVWGSETFVDFEQGLNYAIRQIRSVLKEETDERRFIETIPRRGYRFIAPVTSNGREAIAAVVAPESPRAKWKIVAAALAVLLLAAGLFLYSRREHPSAEKNTILVADFVNRTGDPVFDAILRQGLSIQLQQSPFLRLISEEQVHETLAMMGRADNPELSPGIAREVCERSNAATALDGSIVLIGNRYELVLRAVDCANGDLLASAEARAQDKNHVLDAVSELASKMRRELGESLSGVHRYNISLASATTSSLEALQYYTQGMQVISNNFNYTQSIAWFQKAIELDPNFALAYWEVGDVYAILGETNSAREYTQKAFELREHVSEREKALIEASYYYYVLGDVEKAYRSGEFLRKLYPYSEQAHNSLAAIAESVGQYDVGLSEYLESLRLAPRTSFLYRDVAYTYLVLDRVEEASAVLQRAHEMDSEANLAPVLYSIAFYRDDRREMARQVASVVGKPETEELLFAMDADTAAYWGQLDRARGLSRRAAESAEAAGKRETSTLYDAASAVREALFGYADRAQQQVIRARKRPGGRDVVYGLALASTYAHDLSRGQALTEELAIAFPEDTVVKCNYLPTLRARLAIMRSNPQQAITILGPPTPCELGLPVYSYYNWPNLYPAYVRGEAYLAAHRGAEAAAEFEKILSHRGLVLNEPIGVLAQLQLGRSYALSGDNAKARAAYEKFLALWKEADPDIPVLKEAKAEYAKLQ